MTQQIPTPYMIDPAPRPSMAPTARGNPTVPQVDADTDYTTHLAEGGYPDTSEAAQQFAAAQRMAARQGESRTALTTGGAGPDAVIAPPGSGPAQPIQTVGPAQLNRQQ